VGKHGSKKKKDEGQRDGLIDYSVRPKTVCFRQNGKSECLANECRNALNPRGWKQKGDSAGKSCRGYNRSHEEWHRRPPASAISMVVSKSGECQEQIRRVIYVRNATRWCLLSGR
jgi:hypothetical protein